MEIPPSSTPLPGFLKALAHEMRWKILVALAHSDHTVTELCRFLNQPQNAVSYHLRKLREHQVVSERRSSADSRDFYYSLDRDKFRIQYLAAAEILYPGLCEAETVQGEAEPHRSSAPLRVLFLCTHNSARSQMAEGLLHHLSQGTIDVCSAGSQPTRLHPYAVRAMASLGIDISQQHAKPLETFQSQSFNYIVTVCDHMREACPSFAGDPDLIHWSIPDPVEAEGTDEERYLAFEQTAHSLLTRTRSLFMCIDHARNAHV
jgi:protein-tyrosine-phosphatase/DNA-binding transcriptional ArsR family regulator